MAKKSRGRQRVEMVKMKNENNLQVTFSKRRAGLFKKASELCTLCAAKIAVIIFSPGKKVYCFGHPSLEMVIDKFEGRPPRPVPLSSILIENVTLHQLNAEFAQLSDLLDIESNHGQALTQSLKACQAEKWWEVPPPEMANENIEILRHAMRELKSQVATEVQERVIEVERAVNPNTQFFVGSSSNPSSSHQGLVNPDLKNAGFIMPFNAGKNSFGGAGAPFL